MPNLYRVPIIASVEAGSSATFLTHAGDVSVERVLISVDGARSYRNRAIGEDQAVVFWSLTRGLTVIGSGKVGLSLDRIVESEGPFQPVADSRMPLVFAATFKDGSGPSGAIPTGMTVHFTAYTLTQAVP